MNALVSKLKPFLEKDYRDGYLHTHVRSSIAYQIKALRRKFRLTQMEMAERTDKKQSVISRLESADYGRVSVQTLLDIASGLDVALVVRFVSFPDFLKQAANMSESALQADTIKESWVTATQEELRSAQVRQQERQPLAIRAAMASASSTSRVSAIDAHNKSNEPSMPRPIYASYQRPTSSISDGLNA